MWPNRRGRTLSRAATTALPEDQHITFVCPTLKNTCHSEQVPLFSEIAMQENDHNADDVASSERARQRAKRGQKSSGKKKE